MLDEHKYIIYVLEDVINIPNRDNPNDQFRWHYVLPAIREVIQYWKDGVPEDKRIEVEQMVMAASERANHSPRLACLVAVNSFSNIVEMRNMAVKAWAAYDSVVIEKDGKAYCPAKHNAIKRYMEVLPESPRVERDELHKNGFNHPCKETCSGWQQGYDRGQDDAKSKVAELEKERDGSVLHKLERGKLISIIDIDTAIARDLIYKFKDAKVSE